MKLTSAHAFWLMRNGIGDVALPLTRNHRCDVAIIGCGITGALIADAMTAAGLSVVAIDRRHPCQGSTSASTALLQYEIDTSLVELTEKLGSEHAVDAYKACVEGVRIIGRLAAGLAEDTGFHRRPSFYYASSKADAKELAPEYRARRKAGLPCEYLDQRDTAKMVDFPAPAALWSSVAAEIDPWRFAQALLARAATREFRLYGRTEALGITAERDRAVVHLPAGKIHARHVVVAGGYESERFLPQPVAKLHSSFALVTEPVAEFTGWPQRMLIWETARPYLYARTTPDNRVLVGGEDIPFRNPAHRDRKLPRVADRLLGKARLLFPRIPMEVAYAWAGTFGETTDGLAYIGAHPAVDQRVLFALGFGGNGITYSALAAEILTAKVLGTGHRYEDTFTFDR